MILRKPYAFLIKRFKLIHIIMSVMMIYLAFRTNIVVGYFSDYTNSTTLKGQASNYFNTYMFILIILIIAFSSLVYYLLKYKKKPRITYIVTIIGYLFTLIVFYNSFSVLKELETTLLETKTVRLWKDLLTITLYYQYIMTAIMLIRGMGFDIKKFNFQTDIKELEIDAIDNEEFEFALGDADAQIARKTRKTIRKLRYFIIENKFILTIISSIALSIFLIVFIINITITNKVYKENQTFLTNNARINIKKSYYTKTTSNGKYITNNNDTYLILNLDIQALYNNSQLKLTDFRLIIDDEKYYPTAKYCDLLSDLGKCYNKQKLNTDINNYILVYKIPQKHPQVTLHYEDQVTITNAGIEAKYKKVKLNPTDIDTITTKNTITLNNSLLINNEYIKDTNFMIESYELNKRFFHTYNSCINNICKTKSEVIVTNNLSSQNKTILKLKITYNGPLALQKFIDRYLLLEYQIGDKTYKSSITNKTPSDLYDYVFLEVDSNIISASSITVNIGIRNYMYMFKLK